MNKRTEREFHIALGKLLDRVRVQNSWNSQSFIEAAIHVANVTKSEAHRFYNALVDMNLLIPSSNKRKLKPSFDHNIWTNDDVRNSLMKEILEIYPDIVQKRGKVKGKHYPKKVVEETFDLIELVESKQEEVVNPLSYFSAQDLVTELRNRGFTVTASRQIITTEELW